MTGSLRVTRLNFVAGSRVGADALGLSPTATTIIVGPNNAGKSQLLREIEQQSMGHVGQQQVLRSVSVDMPEDVAEIGTYIRRFERGPNEGQTPQQGVIYLQPFSLLDDISYTHQFGVSQLEGFSRSFEALSTLLIMNNIEQYEQQRAVTHNEIMRAIMPFYVIRLDGPKRFRLIESRPAKNMLEPPSNHLQALAIDDTAREQLRTAVFHAFGVYPALDPVSAPGQWRLSINRREPIPSEERSLTAEAVEYRRSGTSIDKVGDGLKCFCGLHAALLGLPHRVILIDEPEAFLHPPLAYQLGSNLAKLADERQVSLFTATHSADFLLGCVESAKETTIVRLTYDHSTETATARSLLPSDIKKLIANPYVRSANVLRALFHRGVVLTEDDTDRVFYAEMNQRLRDTDRGATDTLFLNGNGKSSFGRVAGPLRKIGVPTAVIPDLDILEDEGGLAGLLPMCGVPKPERQAIDTARAEIAQLFAKLPKAANGGRAIQEQGKSALDSAGQLKLTRLLEDLARYGIFPVPNGQLESWLPQLMIAERKKKWLDTVFDKIGETPDAPHYMKAGAGDIWTFLEDIAKWIDDPSRRGTD